jgi:protein-S-isoprenylcysteine O-methyltransferase Ste14
MTYAMAQRVDLITERDQTRSCFAMVIACIGIAALLLIGGYRAAICTGVFHWVLIGVITLYALWIASEFKVTTSSASQDRSSDRYTCETYASARFLMMMAALGCEPIWSNRLQAWLPIGLALFAIGVALRAWAIRTVGQGYSHRVRTPQAQFIVSAGPYRYVRHPAYAGMLLAHIGVLVLFFNVFALLALFAGLVPALMHRIRVEEQHLLSIPEYSAFAATRMRLVPGVW